MKVIINCETFSELLLIKNQIRMGGYKGEINVQENKKLFEDLINQIGPYQYNGITTFKEIVGCKIIPECKYKVNLIVKEQ